MRFFALLSLMLVIVAMSSPDAATTEQERAEQRDKLADYYAENARTSQLMAHLSEELAEQELPVAQLSDGPVRTENRAVLPSTDLAELVILVSDKVDNQQADIEKINMSLAAVSPVSGWTARSWISLLFAVCGILYALYHYQQFTNLRTQYERTGPKRR